MRRKVIDAPPDQRQFNATMPRSEPPPEEAGPRDARRTGVVERDH
jgi:hypothetical protein